MEWGQPCTQPKNTKNLGRNGTEEERMSVTKKEKFPDKILEGFITN